MDVSLSDDGCNELLAIREDDDDLFLDNFKNLKTY